MSQRPTRPTHQDVHNVARVMYKMMAIKAAHGKFPPAYGEATHHCPSVAAACAEESQDASGSYKDGGC